jgi:hypothetical protein
VTHIFRSGEWKLEDGELYRKATEAGEPIWICVTKWMCSPLERTMLDLIREALER